MATQMFDTAPNPPKPTARVARKLTDQQEAVVKSDGKIVVVNAYAGTGKTTTLVEYAAARPDKKMLYLAFGKPNQIDAEKRFKAEAPNCEARTTHSVAYMPIARRYKDFDVFKNRVSLRYKPTNVMDDLNIMSPRNAAMVVETLGKFFCSTDSEIKSAHVFDGCTEKFQVQDEEVNLVLGYSRALWRYMQDVNHKSKMPPDAYLKMFALTSPILKDRSGRPYDIILFDEAQDANPVTAQIVRNQHAHATVVYVGDSHQSIYGFRGAFNAMESMRGIGQHFQLSKSFRFPQSVADYANLILTRIAGSPNVNIQGLGKPGPFVQKGMALLSRTNAELFDFAAKTRGEGVHWVGGIESYGLDRILDVYFLRDGRRKDIKSDEIKRFKNFDDYKNHGEKTLDGEMKRIAQVVEKRRDDIPDLLDDIKANEVKDAADANLVLTTAHKAKGLEWNCVKVGDDFQFLRDKETGCWLTPAKIAADPALKQEVNLLYVAMTRAKHVVQPNAEFLEFLGVLDQEQGDEVGGTPADSNLTPADLIKRTAGYREVA